MLISLGNEVWNSRKDHYVKIRIFITVFKDNIKDKHTVYVNVIDDPQKTPHCTEKTRF